MSSPASRTAQALDALRHGWPIALDGAFTLLPAETGLGQARARTMLISAARAVTLKLANQREAAEPHAPVLIRATGLTRLAPEKLLSGAFARLRAHARFPPHCGTGSPTGFIGPKRSVSRPRSAITSIGRHASK